MLASISIEPPSLDDGSSCDHRYRHPGSAGAAFGVARVCGHAYAGRNSPSHDWVPRSFYSRRDAAMLCSRPIRGV